ncbi:MAG: DUF433 domain-containing protein [Thermoleophilaceae bacterium]|jgi:uncharacterized protein (DUF433 family)/DNA-binding transcriptional MerR regulator
MGTIAPPDLTAIGHYTAGEVARLAGVSPRRVGSWARYGIIPSVSERPRVYSYADAGEAVLAHYLIDQGMKPRAIRQIVHRLREEHGQWPLAAAPLYHEGKLLLVKRDDGLYDIAYPDEAKVMVGTLIDLRTIREALSRGGWIAYKNPREHIEVDPDRHSGEPVIRGRRITTGQVAALAAQPDGRQSLREDFGLEDVEIDDAIGYESDLAALAA